MVNNPLAMWETQVQSTGWEHLLEKRMATHPVFFLGESHGQRSLEGYSSRGCRESDMTEATNTHFLMLESDRPLIHSVQNRPP